LIRLERYFSGLLECLIEWSFLSGLSDGFGTGEVITVIASDEDRGAAGGLHVSDVVVQGDGEDVMD